MDVPLDVFGVDWGVKKKKKVFNILIAGIMNFHYK